MIRYNSKPVPICITIYPEQLALLNLTGADKSKLIRRAIDITFIENGEIDILIKEKYSDIELLEKLKVSRPDVFPKLETSQAQKAFLNSARRIIKRDGSFMKGQHKAFCNTFNEDIRFADFKDKVLNG